MVRVKNGMRTTAKPREAKEYNPNVAMITIKGIMFMHSSASKIESGKYLILLSAVARQCTMYRSILLNYVPDKSNAEARLRKWASKLPLTSLK